jgi:hypothetical protein
MNTIDRDSPLPDSPPQATMTAFSVERQVSAPEVAEAIFDKDRMAAGLLLSLSFLVGSTIDDVKIEKIGRILPPRRNQGLIDFQVTLRLASDVQVHVGICVLTNPDLTIAIEECRRLLVYKDFGLDRLCIIRQGDLTTNISQLRGCFSKLLSPDIGGVFVSLSHDDVLTIIATLSTFQNKEQYGVTNNSISDYLKHPESIDKNSLVQQIIKGVKLTFAILHRRGYANE